MSAATERQVFAAAAAAVGINPAQLKASETPWQTQHPRAQLWRAAVAQHSPDLAEQYETKHGGELSMALQLALEGHSELTPALATEWQERRPSSYLKHQERVMASAVAALEAATEEIRQRNTPTYAQQQRLAQEREQARQASIAHTNAVLGANARQRGVW